MDFNCPKTTVSPQLVNTLTTVALLATTTIVKRVYTTTAMGRAEALQELYNKVQQRHEHFVKNILPQLKEAGMTDIAFAGTEASTTSLAIAGSLKDQLLEEVSQASTLQRYSVTFMASSIDEVMTQLNNLNKNTYERSTTANKLLRQLREAVYSPGGATIQDGQGNQLNYRATRPPNADDANGAAGPKETKTSYPDQEVAVSTSSVVSIR